MASKKTSSNLNLSKSLPAPQLKQASICTTAISGRQIGHNFVMAISAGMRATEWEILCWPDARLERVALNRVTSLPL
jgi:hypothetical protein